MDKKRMFLLLAACLLSLIAAVIAIWTPKPVELGVRDIEESEPTNRRELIPFTADDGTACYYQMVETDAGNMYQIQPVDEAEPIFLPVNSTVIYTSVSLDESYIEETVLRYVEQGEAKEMNQYQIYVGISPIFSGE